jgi:phenylpropionate dioxygenase-like ring-hydroxylating dioxygenase large terminal subunit
MDMIEAHHWHPVAACASLEDKPLAAKLLDQEIVVWRNAEGHVSVFADQCPHRGARLSLGKVMGNHLECPYHGWQFDGEAQCQRIPSLPELSPSASHKACRYEAREAYGLIWVRLESAAQNLPLPIFAAELEARLRKTNCGPYWVETSAPRIVENFLDMTHFGFVHEHWLGDRSHTAHTPYQLEEAATGIRATQCFAWQPKSSVHATGGAMVEYTYEVVSPYCAVLTKIPESTAVAIAEFKESIALFVCPVEPERSLVWFRLAMNDFASPDSALQSFQDTIFAQDKPILESQKPKRLPLNLKAELHCAADQASAAYRRYLRRLGVHFGTLS